MNIIRIIKSVWIWFACTCLIVCWVPLLGLIRITERDPLYRRTGRWFRRLGRNLARVTPWELEIEGKENLNPRQTYVIVSNHQSLADIPVISFLKIDTKWLAKASLFTFPAVGWMLRMAGDIPVDRADRGDRAKAKLMCAEYLRKGCSVVFFPEGTRTRDGEVQPFSVGAFQLAISEHVPVLPLVVDGSADALPKHSWMFGKPQTIRLLVLKPVTSAGWTVEQSDELRDKVRQDIVDGLARMRSATLG